MSLWRVNVMFHRGRLSRCILLWGHFFMIVFCVAHHLIWFICFLGLRDKLYYADATWRACSVNFVLLHWPVTCNSGQFSIPSLLIYFEMCILWITYCCTWLQNLFSVFCYSSHFYKICFKIYKLSCEKWVQIQCHCDDL